ncbi:MAG TPA: MltR family transcriptional regulator [Pyrinomonadaceae bacterium]|nr:MltR family transcriptional regulator [Pyrinomonadaceae bacterium]
MTRRSLVPVEGLSKDGQSVYDVLNGEPDLSAVLVAASYIDACLGALLEGFFLKSSVATKMLDAKGGSLGSFNSRSDACYCLGLINKRLYQDLLVIAEIRNQFAHHHLALSFAVPEVAEQCEKLSYVAGLRNGNSDEPLLDSKHLRTPRNRLVLSAVLISQQLLIKGLEVKHVQPRV